MSNSDAGDGALEGLAEVFTHEFHLFVFDAGALGLCCCLFHVATMLAEFLVFELADVSSALGISCQETVNHEVGVAADG